MATDLTIRPLAVVTGASSGIGGSARFSGEAQNPINEHFIVHPSPSAASQ